MDGAIFMENLSSNIFLHVKNNYKNVNVWVFFFLRPGRWEGEVSDVTDAQTKKTERRQEVKKDLVRVDLRLVVLIHTIPFAVVLRHEEVQDARDDDREEHEAEPDDDALLRHRPVVAVVEELADRAE